MKEQIYTRPVLREPAWDLHHSLDIDVPFPHAKNKKIVGADFEKIDKADFRDIHMYTHTDQSDLIGPFPSGVQN